MCHFVSSMFEGYVPEQVEHRSRGKLLFKISAAILRGSYDNDMMEETVIFPTRNFSSE